MNGADVLCDTLLAGDVDVCFANPGTSEMHFVAALDRKPAMRCVLGLFEGVVTGAADGYARMADKPAATLLHLGPGLANGLANLHNARRAGTPVVNIVGEHATDHLPYDAPLTSDIESLARPMSAWVGRIGHSDEVGERAAQAIAASRVNGGSVATLILPADAAWGETMRTAPIAPDIVQAGIPDDTVIDHVAARLRNGRRTLLLISGKGLRADALAVAGRIAQATGARMLAQQSNARIERGAGRVPIERVLYNIDACVADLADIDQLVLVGAREPVGFFAYPGKPSAMLPARCEVTRFTERGHDALASLQALADRLGVRRDASVTLAAPSTLLKFDRPSGALTPASIAAAVGRHLPEGAIVCDEAITSGHAFFKHTTGAAPHDFLALTGGAIGSGLPMGTGAAVACPDRKVVCLQADGSGMFTLQSLWTQARERLDVVTIIFANRGYAILHNELKQVGAGVAGHNARRMLDVVDPTLDWVHLAAGMGVEAACVNTLEAFDDVFAMAMRQRGPFLIEASI
ncbi:acetolactate synthase large subunit [Pandoraea commovens]|uniref:Acetolactate synthase large subunit n=1 Tax=Pandoraea commovens TaxID=2508289 RepID=A0ABY5QKQ4_9BURK|nr:acetolactate synthase large subunit [Pandoraea commovens]UVA80990.1 acetolactate synthase large subunit [Pandoraea commovens]